MGLIDMPYDILAIIAKFLDNLGDIRHLSRSHRKLYLALDEYLYRFDAVLMPRRQHRVDDTGRDDDEYLAGRAYIRGEAHALRWALYSGNVTVARKAIRGGAQVQFPWFDRNAWPWARNGEFELTRVRAAPLAIAVRNDDRDMVELLVENGARANETLNHSKSVIFHAIRKGAVNIVRLISGAEGHDWTVTDRTGQGVLQVAATLPGCGMVKYLLSVLDEPDGRPKFSTERTLHLAIVYKRYRSANLLMRSAHVDRKLVMGIHWHNSKLLKPESIPIYEACFHGPLAIVRHLVEEEYRTSPLPDLCIYFAAANGQRGILDYLLGRAPSRAELDWLLLSAVKRASVHIRSKLSGHQVAKLCIGLADLPNSTRQAEWLAAVRGKGWSDLEEAVEGACQDLDLEQEDC